MVQIEYRNRELTSYSKINHVFVSSKAVFTAGALSSQYQAAITLCKQSYVGTQNTIEIHNIEINPLAINLEVSGSGWVVTWLLLGYTVRKNGGLLSTPMV